MALITTIEEVQRVSGVSVSADILRRAQTVIDLICGRELDDAKLNERVNTRDLGRLKLAVAYQAAWMDAHPEVFSTMDVASIDQDDLNVKFRDNPEAQLLAPLAKMALSRVSWRNRGMASVSVNSAFQGRNYIEDWRPIRMGGR